SRPPSRAARRRHHWGPGKRDRRALSPRAPGLGGRNRRVRAPPLGVPTGYSTTRAKLSGPKPHLEWFVAGHRRGRGPGREWIADHGASRPRAGPPGLRRAGQHNLAAFGGAEFLDPAGSQARTVLARR